MGQGGATRCRGDRCEPTRSGAGDQAPATLMTGLGDGLQAGWQQTQEQLGGLMSPRCRVCDSDKAAMGATLRVL